MKWPILILAIAVVLAALAFVLTGGPAPGDIMVKTDDVALAELDKVAEARWQSLLRKRILFGHQSVGRDILAGIAAIGRDRPAIALRVVNGDAAALGDGAGLAELAIGSNSDPVSKIQDFERHVRAAGARLDLAFLKLCYVDVVAGTDAAALLATYRDAMARLAKDVPGTRLLHCTVPLTAIRTDWKARLGRMIGKTPWDDESNRVRFAFNALMRAEYAGKGTLIDLAEAEATLPDGTMTTWQTGDTTYQCLAACYTHDGGHLGEVGQRAVARLVLRKLAEAVGSD